MAFSDPQSVTISGTAHSLPNTSRDGESGVYTNADGTVRLTVSHQTTSAGRKRRQLRIDHLKVAADPYDSTRNVDISMSLYLVVDVPKQGYTAAEQKAVWDGFELFATASSDAAITKLLGGES